MVCDPGYEKHVIGGSTCRVCSIGYYCNGMNDGYIGHQICPIHSTSLGIGAISQNDCFCEPGYYDLNGEECTICPFNYYCINETMTQCPSYTNSNQGSYISP